MGIDKRVAHGIAGRHLKDALNDSIRVLGRVRAAIDRRSTRPATSKGARRELHEIRQAVIRHSLWWTEGDDRHNGPFLAWLGAFGDADGELVLTRYRVAPAAKRSSPVQAGTAGCLSLHAVARCLQRNGTLSWADVKPALADATAYLLLMTDVARVSGLRQIPVPAGNGLFVGDFQAEVESIMETYLVLDDSQFSRWTPVRNAVLGAVKAAGLTPEAAYTATCFGRCPIRESAVSSIAQALASFRWLREDYNPRLDPVSAAWRDYRAKAA